MDSVRYHSYHQWKEASKADSHKTSTYHEKLLTNVEALEGNVSQIDKLIAGYLDATKAFCGAGSQLAEAFSTILNETPLLELPQQLKQVIDEVDHVAHKSGVHITNHILATLCEFTATLPGLRRAIEAHKRSVQNYESCQENLDALENDAVLANDGKRLKTARARFRSATDELATEEERLYRSFTEVEENRVKMLGSCFLSLLQVQSQFMGSAADLMSPLGGFQEIGDYLRDREVTLALKDATSTWLSLAQANQALRQTQGLSRQNTMQLTWGELCDPEKKKLVHCVETLLKNYKKEFERAPTPAADIPAGFHKNPKGIELALQGFCSQLECLAAGGLVEPQSREEMEAQILRKIPKLILKLGHVVTEACPSPSKVNDNFKSKMHCIRDLVSSVAKQNDIPLNKENLEMFVLMVFHETCSPVASSTAQTAVQLVFGKANLVEVKPSCENTTRHAHVYIKGTSVHVEVSTSWVITEDKTTFSTILNDLDISSPLGIVDAVYTAKFSLMDYLEEKERPLPTIRIKRLSQPQSPQATSSKEASPVHKHKGFRKSFSKATSKIFSRKSSSLKVGSGNVAAVADVTNPDGPVSGAGAGNEVAGVRTSVASSTDTSNEHETGPSFDSPVPLPPPRPKRWAKKVRAQNMTNQAKDAGQGDGSAKRDTPQSDEWFNSEPKLPMPLFKPTIQGAESFMSLASQEELDEVINLLSGAPLAQASGQEEKFAEGSHMTPIDSGMGSLLSVPTSSISISRPSAANLGASLPQVHVSAAGSDTKTASSTQASSEESRPQSPEKETVDTQTSPTDCQAPADCDPVQVAASNETVNADPSETTPRQEGATDPSETRSADTQASPELKTHAETERSQDESPQGKEQEPSVDQSDVVSGGDAVEQNSVKEEEEVSTPSPNLPTASSTDDSAEDKVSIVDSLRNVWLKAEPEPVARTTEELPGKLKERSGSHETLYHSCWSLSDFSEKAAHGENGKEDTKSLNEGLLKDDASGKPLDLGLKWSNFGNNPVWENNPKGGALQAVCWRRSDETLHREGGGNNAFSLGLGITGPELFAAARGTSFDALPVEAASQMPMHKPWSTEDLSQKDPWPSRDTSPPLLWSKAHSLSQDAHRPGQARGPFLPQHHSEPYLPNERWWVPGGAPPPPPPPPGGQANHVYQRYPVHLRRQYALDGPVQGLPAGTHRLQPAGVFVQSAFQPVRHVYAKTTNQGRQLQVPPQYGLGHGNHHGSNPRF